MANHNKKVDAGSIVTLKDQETKIITYTIVGPLESDPASGKISIESPLGQALIGKKKGDKVQVTLPSGKASFEITKIE